MSVCDFATVPGTYWQSCVIIYCNRSVSLGAHLNLDLTWGKKLLDADRWSCCHCLYQITLLFLVLPLLMLEGYCSEVVGMGERLLLPLSGLPALDQGRIKRYIHCICCDGSTACLKQHPVLIWLWRSLWSAEICFPNEVF